MPNDWATRARAFERRAVEVSLLGRALIDADLAASLASDHLMATGAAGRIGATGWVVERGHDGHEVLFVDGSQPPRAIWSTTFAADGAVMGREVPPRQGRLPPRLAAGARARATVLDLSEAAGCTVIVPPLIGDAEPGPITAYLILEGRPGDLVLGVHRRVTVSSDGGRVTAMEDLSRSRLVVPGDRGAVPADVVATHLDGDTPHEAHVYLSLRHGVPIEVLTVPSGLHWRVDGESLTVLGPLPERTD